MVVANYHQRRKKTKQFFLRSFLRLKIRSTKEWAFMDKVPYEVLIMPLPVLYRQETRSLQETERGKIINPTAYFILSPKPNRSQYCRESLRFYPRLLHNK